MNRNYEFMSTHLHLTGAIDILSILIMHPDSGVHLASHSVHNRVSFPVDQRAGP